MPQFETLNPVVGWSAASASTLRPSADASMAFFSSWGSAIGFSQPGIVSSRKPLSKQMRGDGVNGTVNASTRAPRSVA